MVVFEELSFLLEWENDHGRRVSFIFFILEDEEDDHTDERPFFSVGRSLLWMTRDTKGSGRYMGTKNGKKKKGENSC